MVGEGLVRAIGAKCMQPLHPAFMLVHAAAPTSRRKHDALLISRSIALANGR